MNSPSKPALTAGKKAAYGLLATLLFFGGLELLLALAGVQPNLTDRDPFVGFESSIPLFVSSTDKNGAEYLRTAANKLAFFNPQRFPRRKGDQTVRIFCLGGSTTFGRPFDDRTSFAGWLREFLPLADPSRDWEVVNAGGVSYASYRIASLLDELVRYSPDLFIMYTGQNEFLEERTYGDVKSASSSLRRWTTPLHRSRTYSLAHRLLSGQPESSAGRSVLPGEVDAILDHATGPDAYERDEAFQAAVLDHFDFNLARIVQTARSVGAEVILIKPAVNLKDFSPFKSEHARDLDAKRREQWTDLMTRADKVSHDPGQALELLEKAASIDVGRADLHFNMGRIHFASEQYDQARRSFQRAVDNDVCPLRATQEIQRLVEQAALTNCVPLVDFDGILENACLETHGHNCPGEEYFLDHVHPTVSAHRLLALAVIQAMTQKQLLQPGQEWGDEAVSIASRRVESRIDAELQARALTNLAQVLSWAGKQKEAGPLARQAVALRSQSKLDDDPESMFYAAVSLATNGRDAEATALLEKVVQLEPKNAQARWRLAALLYDQVRYEESLVHFREAVRLDPGDAYSFQMLGAALGKLGRYDDALVAYRRAAELDPGNPGVQASINLTLQRIGGG